MLLYIVISRPAWAEIEVFSQPLPSFKAASLWPPIPVTSANSTFSFTMLFDDFASAF